MKKKVIVLVVIVMLLSSCSSFGYKTKSEDNPDYYIDYLTELGYSNIELEYGSISKEVMNLTYEFNGYDIETKSDFIYFYTCYDNEGNKYNAFMPDRVGEDNIVFKDFLLTDSELIDIVDNYNNTTEGVIISIEGNDINTLDIILNLDQIGTEFVEDWYIERTINGVQLDFDSDLIKDIIRNNLSSALVYNIGRYYIYGSSSVMTVFLGYGPNDTYVLLAEDMQNGTVEILHTFQNE